MRHSGYGSQRRVGNEKLPDFWETLITSPVFAKKDFWLLGGDSMSLFPPKERREGVLFPFMARSKVKKGLETVGFGHRTTGSLSLTHMHTPLATVTQHSLHTWPPEMCPHIGQVPTGNSSWKIAGGRLPLRRAAHFTFSLIDRDGGGR